MPAFADDLWLGVAPGPQLNGQIGVETSPKSQGVGPLGRVYIFDVVPITLDADGICAAQAISGTNVSATIAGDLASGGSATLDCARALQMVSSSASDTTQTVTVTGTDYWNQPQVEVKTLNGTNAVNFLKAFKTVTRVVVSATMVGNLTLGTRDAIGMPYRVTDAAYILSVKWASTLASDAGTFVAAVTTDPNTSAIGDVRGTYLPSSAANGTRRLVMALALPALAVGPSATQIGAVGVPPATA